MAFLVLEDESHHQGNARITARLRQMRILSERFELERRVTFNRTEQADICLATWIAIADEVGGDPTEHVFQGTTPPIGSPMAHLLGATPTASRSREHTTNPYQVVIGYPAGWAVGPPRPD